VHSLGLCLESLHDDQMLCFVLQQTQKLAHYTSFGRKNKKFVGVCSLLSSGDSESWVCFVSFVFVNFNFNSLFSIALFHFLGSFLFILSVCCLLFL
jgi:hypothetical protein